MRSYTLEIERTESAGFPGASRDDCARECKYHSFAYYAVVPSSIKKFDFAMVVSSLPNRRFNVTIFDVINSFEERAKFRYECIVGEPRRERIILLRIESSN